MGMFDKVKVESSGSGEYLRLKDGDNFKIRFYGEVVVYVDNYGNTRWGNIVWNHTEGKAQAYSFTKTIVNRVKELENDEDWGDVREYDVKVSRVGSTKEDTEYNLTPSPKSQPLNEEQINACKELDPLKMFKGSVTVEALENGVLPDGAEDAGYKKARAIAEKLGAKFDDDEPVDLSEIPF